MVSVVERMQWTCPQDLFQFVSSQWRVTILCFKMKHSTALKFSFVAYPVITRYENFFTIPRADASPVRGSRYMRMLAVKQMNILRQSWIRSRNYGFQKADHPEGNILTGRALKQKVAERKSLIHHTLFAFDGLSSALRQWNAHAFLVDVDGTIIESVGHRDFERRAAQVQLQNGANWSEQQRGTNAIGTALIEKKPVSVFGRQHYLAVNGFLSCVAAPLFSPEGEFMGVIDISAPRDMLPGMALQLVMMTVEAVQNRILFEDARRKNLLMVQELEHAGRVHGVALISLDADRRVVRANGQAQRLLGRHCLGQPLSRPDLFRLESVYDNTAKQWSFVGSNSKNDRGRALSEGLFEFKDIYGSCRSIERAVALGRRAAAVDLPVLLHGESGTGKELLAQSIHSYGSRGPFVAVNCSAIPESLIESELFGYVPHAFTGASKQGSRGKFVAAHQGTLFLDEIGDMPLRAQAALLRVLQEKCVYPVGAVKPIPVDVRIIAATHRNLPAEIEAGRFRSDLYYRLKVISIELPPLRERSDLEVIARMMLIRMEYPETDLSAEVLRALHAYSWPGNLRELHNVLSQAAFLAEGGPICTEHLCIECREESAEALSLHQSDARAIIRAIQLADGNIKKAAQILGIGRTTLYRKMKLYNLQGESADGAVS